MNVTLIQLIENGAGVNRHWFYGKFAPAGAIVTAGFYQNYYDTEVLKTTINQRIDQSGRSLTLAKKHYEALKRNCNNVLMAIQKLESMK